MKHQYFGDVNDYRKYGLLRALGRSSGLRLGIWWMLTPDDGRTDGKFTSYLAKPDQWRHFDPPLFDTLASRVPERRSVSQLRAGDLVEGTIFEDRLVPDGAAARRETFVAARAALAGAELVFTDPDNGLEIRSCPAGRKDSSKYLMHAEVRELYGAGHSLLIYQHFVREERQGFIQRIAASLRATTGAEGIACFKTSNVAFFLVPQARHGEALSAVAALVPASWAGQFEVWPDREA